ncbi:MAG: hypothetical protein DCC55_15535 [Chloroflexi bacterium]|nr:MAG: hypothetical protein DCC55_15535 [Chloroflexota bacterium]
MTTISSGVTNLFRSFQGRSTISATRQDELADELRPLRTLVLMALAGIGVLFLYGLHDVGRFFAIVTVGVMVAGAALVLGGLVGFLFGIPRTVQGNDAAANGATDGPGNASSARYGANTNLERVSDWLTTLLVALTVIELPNIWQGVISASENLAGGFGGGAGASPMALGAMLYFASIGFMFGFLWTRLFLPVAYRRTDIAMLVNRAEVDTIVNITRTLDSSPTTAFPAAIATSAESGSAPPLALWVDDTPSNNSSLVTSFEKLFGLNFDLCLATEPAVARTAPGKYRVIISDMSRPPDSRAGYTLLHRLRANGVTTPFIIYAARGVDPRNRAEAQQLGAFGMTNSPQELLQLVRAALEAQPAGPVE